MGKRDVDDVWNHPRFSLPEADPYENYCPDARKFQPVLDKLLELVRTKPSQTRIKKAKLELIERYFWARYRAPLDHQNHASDEHTCLFHLFVRAYDEIYDAQLQFSDYQLEEPAESTQPGQGPEGLFRLARFDYELPLDVSEDDAP